MDIRLPAFLADCSRDDILDASYWLEPVEVDFGAPLMEEGDEDASLVVVVGGELSIRSGGAEIALAGPEDVVGATAVFGESLRTEAVRAVAPSYLLVLDRQGYDVLREARNGVAYSIERAVLRQLARRLAEREKRVLPLCPTPSGLPTPPGVLRRLLSRWTGPTYAEVVEDDALFAKAGDLGADVAERFSLRRFAPGDVLYRAGEPVSALHLVASGAVEIVADREGEDVSVATVGAGEACGVCGVVLGTPSPTTAIAREPVVTWGIDAAAWATIASADDPLGSAARATAIRAAAARLAAADARQVMLETERRRSIAAALAPLKEERRAEARWSSSVSETA